MKKNPLAQSAYDALADAYAANIDTKPHNAYYERPATLSLLPDVGGKRVLDAGCGPGAHATWLLAHGASVVCLDGNGRMVERARQRLGEKVQVLQANLEEPLDFLEADSFDIVLCALVMEYIRDWVPVLAEFHRLLRHGGWLVYSISHPLADFLRWQETSNYFETELLELTWNGFGISVNVPFYRRSLAEVINPLIQSGFVLDRLLEPLPTEQFRQADPQEYEILMHKPEFICLRALKP